MCTRLLSGFSVWLRSQFYTSDRNRQTRGKIVIFHIGRSGSTDLGDLLQLDKRLFWDGEVIRNFIRNSANREPEKVTAYMNERSLLAGSNQFYGCEVKPFHIRMTGTCITEFIADLENCGFKHFIVLERRNYLSKDVSSLIASHSERWHNSACGNARRASVTIDTDIVNIDDTSSSLLEPLELYSTESEHLRSALASRNALWLSYEDDIGSDPRVAYRKICGFLDLQPANVKTRYAKANPLPLAELIDNYDEVCTTLQGTRFARMTENNTFISRVQTNESAADWKAIRC